MASSSLDLNPNQLERYMESLDELEFEWIRQWCIQGGYHAKTHGWWQPQVQRLVRYWNMFHSRLAASIRALNAHFTASVHGSLDHNLAASIAECCNVLQRGLQRTQSLREGWKAREADPVYAGLPSEHRPITPPLKFCEPVGEELSELLMMLGHWGHTFDVAAAAKRTKRNAVGDRLRVWWEHEDEQAEMWYECEVVESRPRKVRRKSRCAISEHIFLLKFGADDKKWTRLAHRPQYPLTASADIEQKTAATGGNTHSWECDSADHAETPLQAYRDIVPLLGWIARKKGVQPEELVIYDPYYCNGQVVAHLNSIGFPHVINQPVDFYEAQRLKTVPAYDVLVTNPPYSADHVPRLLKFAEESGLPYLLLMPNYVCTMPYYSMPEIRYWVPPWRYCYVSPQFLRAELSKKQRKHVAPFFSFWYLGLPASEFKPSSIARFSQEHSTTDSEGCRLYELDQIPHNLRGTHKQDPLSLFRKRFNQFCQENKFGKLCAQFSFTGRCKCPDKDKSVFKHKFQGFSLQFKRFLADGNFSLDVFD